MSAPDPRPPKRLRDTAAMRALHQRGGRCLLCASGFGPQLHHVLARGSRGDDLEANLVWLCTGCHGLVHAGDVPALRLLGQELVARRPDVIAYLESKLGEVGAWAWLERRLHVTP